MLWHAKHLEAAVRLISSFAASEKIPDEWDERFESPASDIFSLFAGDAGGRIETGAIVRFVGRRTKDEVEGIAAGDIKCKRWRETERRKSTHTKPNTKLTKRKPHWGRYCVR